MEKLFIELYKDLHSSSTTQENPLKKFLFSTRQHVLIIFYISSQPEQKTTLEEICFNISPKIVSRSTVQNILKEGCKINFFEKHINKKDKREKFYKLTITSSELMHEWAFNQKTIFSSLNDLVKK